MPHCRRLTIKDYAKLYLENEEAELQKMLADKGYDLNTLTDLQKEKLIEDVLRGVLTSTQHVMYVEKAEAALLSKACMIFTIDIPNKFYHWENTKKKNNIF